MPSLLPRTWLVQGLASGISVAFGYGIGVLLAWATRHVVPVRPSEQVRAVTRRIVWVLALILVPLMLWLGSAWQNDIRRLVHYPTQSRYVYLGVLLVAALAAMALLAICRAIRHLYRVLARWLGRWIPRDRRPDDRCRRRRRARVGHPHRHRRQRAAGDARRGVLRSRSRHASRHGATHVRAAVGQPGIRRQLEVAGARGPRRSSPAGPTAAEISAVTGRPAITPIRVYAGRESASSLSGEATLVLDELKRTHAFDRAVVAVATSTGTGWIDPWEADPLEYMFGGNTAIASIQYSFYPSWISFLIDRPRAEEAGRVLFDTVYKYWATLPPAHRARLVVFGESLGSYGGSAAFDNVDQLLARTDGALFTGPPNTTAMWRTLTASRRPGSLERLPVVGDGETVRFAADAKQLYQPDGSLSHPRVVFLQHGSDPIVWWSPQLLWSEPDWLTEPRAPDVVPQTHWYPIVSFWQITCDMIAAAAPPPGYGHNYGAEIITAWQAILHPHGWTRADTTALAEHGV